jgi:hypothetical protein
MFIFSAKHIEEYHALGYTVFRDIVPPKLIDELRRECDRGTAITRERSGANAQRFQPISALPIEPKPFEEFGSLLEINDAVSRIITMPFEMGDVDHMGVLLEPAADAWCTQWHRDWRDNVLGLDISIWEAQYQELELFNQVNCALYEDSCTWVVPGSHLRPDTDAEFAHSPTRPVIGPMLNGLSPAERERACLEYCESLPGATRLLLDVGDFCLYRSTLWHLGNYIPYRKRATLHSGVMTEAYKVWFDTMSKAAAERVAAGASWENPNQHRLTA